MTTVQFADVMQQLLAAASATTVAVAVSLTVFRLIRRAANTL